jgi:uncharacterized repeat protein (TIGR03943 family)
VRRDATNVLLVLVGGALVKITVTGTSLRYVRPGATPWVFAAGMVLIGLGATAIVRDLLGGQRGADVPLPNGHEPSEHEPDERQRHDGHRHSGRGAWLLVLPVMVIFLVAPPALGADSVLRAGNPAVSPTAQAFPPLPRTPIVPMAVSEFVARSVWSAAALRVRKVALTGFVVHERDTDYVARLVITCCAADATPMKVALTGGYATRLPDDQWVEVDGVLRPGSVTDSTGYTPTLIVSSLTVVSAPTDPYEY